MSAAFDVLVIGGGAVGAVSAALLSDDRQRRVGLIDLKRPQMPDADSDFDPRVVAISPGSRNILSAVGAWQAAPPDRLAAFTRMSVHSGSGSIEYRAAEHGLPCLGWIAEIPTLAAAAWSALETAGRVELLAGSRLENIDFGRDRITLTLADGARLTARLVVAADGARSRLRRLAGIETDSWHYNQHAVIAHVECERTNPGQCWQRFTDDGPLAFLPLPDGRSSIVWSLPSEQARQLQGAGNRATRRALNRAADDLPFGRVVAVGQVYALPLIRRQARSLVDGRLVLAGDAGRTVHPLAGQGLNLGLLDAAALAEVLEDWTPRQDPGESLARYDRWRTSAGAMVANGLHAINELSAERTGLGRRLMGLGFAAGARLWPARELFVQRACGLDADSPRLARGQNGRSAA